MDIDPLAVTTNAPRKVKFKPKAPPKRVKKEPKAEIEEDDDIDEAKTELLRRFHETTQRRPKTERKASNVRVAFGAGGSSRNYNYAKEEVAKEEEYKEPWDYYKYYPVTLPMRRPYAGNPEHLDKEEFGDVKRRPEPEECASNAAQELGLLDEDEKDNMFFLQLPAMLPAVAQPTDSEVPESKNNVNPSRGRGKSQNLCKLDSLPEGLIGKMLVYKSGAVKLKIGDILYDVSTGLNCTFAQDLVAINAERKLCCNFGELNKRAVVTPDIDSMIEAMAEAEL